MRCSSYLEKKRRKIFHSCLVRIVYQKYAAIESGYGKRFNSKSEEKCKINGNKILSLTRRKIKYKITSESIQVKMGLFQSLPFFAAMKNKGKNYLKEMKTNFYPSTYL